MPILIVLMFLLGIDINKKAFTDIARHPKAVLLGASGNMLCIAHECNPTYISEENKNRYGEKRRNQEIV